MGVAMRELIPLLIKCRVTKSIIGTQVNNPLAHFYKLGNRFHGCFVRQGQENKRTRLCDPFGLKNLEGERWITFQGRKDLGQGLTRVLLGGNRSDLHPGMVVQ
jgi:hypothetical protein